MLKIWLIHPQTGFNGFIQTNCYLVFVVCAFSDRIVSISANNEYSFFCFVCVERSFSFISTTINRPPPNSGCCTYKIRSDMSHRIYEHINFVHSYSSRKTKQARITTVITVIDELHSRISISNNGKHSLNLSKYKPIAKPTTIQSHTRFGIVEVKEEK